MKPSVIAEGETLRPDNASILPNGCLGLEVGGVVVAVLAPGAWSRVIVDPLAFAKIRGAVDGRGVLDLSA